MCTPPSTTGGTVSKKTAKRCLTIYNEAFNAYQRNNYEKAVECFNEIVNLGCEESREIAFYKAYSRSLELLMHYDSAKNVVMEGLEKNPNNAGLLFRKNSIYKNIEDNKNIEENLSSAKEQNSDSIKNQIETITFETKLKDLQDHNPELFLPKDQFESTVEYQKRLKIKDNLIAELKDEYEKEQIAIIEENKRLELQKLAEIEQSRRLKVQESLKEFESSIARLDKYNADLKKFPIYVSGISRPYNVTVVDKKEAKEFFLNKKDIKIKGYQRMASKRTATFTKDGPIFSKPVGSNDNTKISAKISAGESYKVIGENEKGYKISLQNTKQDAPYGYVEKSIVKTETELKEYKTKYFNMVAYNPFNKKSYPFGTHEDLESGEFINPIVYKSDAVPPKFKKMIFELEDPDDDGFLDAGDKWTIRVSLNNIGDGSAGGVIIRMNNESKNEGISSFPRSKYIGTIESEETKTVEFNISVSKAVQKKENVFTISVEESSGFPPEPLEITILSRSFDPPRLALIESKIEGFFPDKIVAGDVNHIKTRIRNLGQGTAKNVNFSIDFQKGVSFLPDSKKDFSFPSLDPGDFVDLEFSIVTSKSVEDSVTVFINYKEENGSGTFSIIKKVDRPQAYGYEVVISGKEKNKKSFKNVATLSIDIEKNIPKTGMENQDAFAVIIGNRDYSGDIPNVDFAVRDAQFVKEYLIKTMGYREGNIFSYNNATRAQIGVAFKKLKNAVKPKKSDVFVYYSGHGAPDPDSNQGYFVPVDADPNYIMESGYPVNDLYKLLKQTNARNTMVVIDACFSGSSDQGMILKDISPVFIEVDDSFLDSKNSAVFTSATGEQVSSWYRDKSHSLFTYYFLKGLQGEADLNRDGNLVLSEMKKYIDDNVPYMARKINNREQKPQLMTDDESRVLVKY